MRCSFIVALLLAGCAAPRPDGAGGDDVVVQSWKAVDVAPLNLRIDDGIAAGATWAASPLDLTIELLAGDVDCRVVRLSEVKNRAEGADTTVVVIARDGFLDDSMRGDWHRIVYRREADGTWRLHEARRAYRCWRGRQQDAYVAERCP